MNKIMFILKSHKAASHLKLGSQCCRASLLGQSSHNENLNLLSMAGQISLRCSWWPLVFNHIPQGSVIQGLWDHCLLRGGRSPAPQCPSLVHQLIPASLSAHRSKWVASIQQTAVMSVLRLHCGLQALVHPPPGVEASPAVRVVCVPFSTLPLFPCWFTRPP